VTAGRVWPAEWSEYEDKTTGAKVKRLTSYKGHSHHLYFTNPGWHDGGRRMLFGSDRDNRTNLFSIDLESGEITQLTDRDRGGRFLGTTVNPTRPEAYFWCGRGLTAVGLNSLELRTLWEHPDGFRPSMINCTADGKYVCGSISEDLSQRFNADYHESRDGFRGTCEAKPLSRVFRAATDGSGCETIWEENSWIGHVNTSPTQPNLLTFCHEGPWAIVDNRIWGLDHNIGEPWKIRERRDPDENVGHEYWYADGVHVGYHGTTADGQPYFGHIKHDNTGHVEGVSAGETGHIHSNDHTLIVGDGGRGSPGVKLWHWNGESYDGPRLLCTHRSSFHIQQLHVHPRFDADGTHVVFTTDRSGYGQVYLATVQEFESLPDTEEGT